MDNLYQQHTRSRTHSCTHTPLGMLLLYKSCVSIPIENNRYRSESTHSRANANMMETECSKHVHNKARIHTLAAATAAAAVVAASNVSGRSTAHTNDPSCTKPKPLFKPESSVYLRLVDVVITSCKQHKKAFVCRLSSLARRSRRYCTPDILLCLFIQWNFITSSIAPKRNILNLFWCRFIADSFLFFLVYCARVSVSMIEWWQRLLPKKATNSRTFKFSQIRQKNDDESTWQNWVYAFINRQLKIKKRYFSANGSKRKKVTFIVQPDKKIKLFVRACVSISIHYINRNHRKQFLQLLQQNKKLDRTTKNK